jgi:hypothetical protein
MAPRDDRLDWPRETLVTVMRNALQERGANGKCNNWGGTKGTRAEAAMKQGPHPPAFSPNLFDLVPLYPFTKGVDLTNDGVGYGEQTKLSVQCATGRSETKLSRRTRTGNFCLRLAEPAKQEHRTKRMLGSGAPDMPGGDIPDEMEPTTQRQKR